MADRLAGSVGPASSVAFESAVVKDYPISVAPAGELVLRDCSATCKWLVRAAGHGPVADRLGTPFGRSTKTTGALVLGSRPGEWIVLGSGEGVGRVIDGVKRVAASRDAGLVTTLDWTHGRALFRLSGWSAARALEKVCSLDWSDPMTPDGAVASASVAGVSCDIARDDVDTPSYLVFCDRSFGQYLFDALLDAGAEFDACIVAAGPAAS